MGNLGHLDLSDCEAIIWFWDQLRTLFPGEVRATRQGLAFPTVKLLIEIDAWTQWMGCYARPARADAGWETLRLTTSSLKSMTRQLDVLRACAAYANAEAATGQGP